MGDIAKLIGGGLGSTNVADMTRSLELPKRSGGTSNYYTKAPTAVLKSEKLIRVANCLPAPVSVDIEDIKKGEALDGVRILVASLTVDQIRGADLKVSDTEIELSIPSATNGNQMLTLLVGSNNRATFKFDVNNTAAKMSKKKFQIEITAKSCNQ